MSRLLLDTHVFIWWCLDDRRLRREARDAIGSADIVFVSAASAWECAIKRGLGRLSLPASVESGVVANGFEKLLVSFAHAEAVAALPPHHNDPFDRLLVAQAQLEGLLLVTHDRRMEPYGLQVLWT